jgi:predicted nucleic acid-binding protein
MALSELLESQDDVCTCGLVVTEVFQGLKNGRSRSEIARLFREMTFLEPSGIDAYLRAAELFRRLREKAGPYDPPRIASLHPLRRRPAVTSWRGIAN